MRNTLRLGGTLFMGLAVAACGSSPDNAASDGDGGGAGGAVDPLGNPGYGDAGGAGAGSDAAHGSDAAGGAFTDASSFPDGASNATVDGGVDAGPLSCSPHCGIGAPCTTNGACESGACGPDGFCAVATSTDGIKDGTETDIDCGGGAPTNAPACATGKGCKVGNDCVSQGCSYKNTCADAISCTGQHGGDTCGPLGSTESCCTTIAVAKLPVTAGAPATASIDKYNITAGRMRAFVAATNGDMRTWIGNHVPPWWNAAWTPYLPTVLDSGNSGSPLIGDGVYQELGPFVHPPGAEGSNEGCFIKNNGARSYRLPDATNTAFGDSQSYPEEIDDERPMNCVPAYIVAAFCAWDGGHLPTHQQFDYVWGPALYPWGAPAGAAPTKSGNPVGYQVAYPTDPQGGVPNGPIAFGGLSWGAFQVAPTVAFSAPPTASQIADLHWANYNYNYWGGVNQVGTDYTMFIAQPGRFPLGNGPYGHADLAGNVFDAAEIVGATACWSRSGSWQGHGIPYTPSGCGVNVPATNKYWAMGGRCAR